MAESSRIFKSITLTPHGLGNFVALAIANDGTAWSAATSAINGGLKVDGLKWKQVDPLPGLHTEPGKNHSE